METCLKNCSTLMKNVLMFIFLDPFYIGGRLLQTFSLIWEQSKYKHSVIIHIGTYNYKNLLIQSTRNIYLKLQKLPEITNNIKRCKIPKRQRRTQVIHNIPTNVTQFLNWTHLGQRAKIIDTSDYSLIIIFWTDSMIFSYLQ